MLSDEANGRFSHIMLAHLYKYQFIFNKAINRTHQLTPLTDVSVDALGALFQELINDAGVLASPECESIYDKLVENFFRESSYSQKFIDRSGNLIAQSDGMHNYHLNIGAVIFISFLCEFELFALIHEIMPQNILNQQLSNYVASIFQPPPTAASTSSTLTASNYRTYKQSIVNTDVFTILRNFTQKLDEIFTYFMNNLVQYVVNMYGQNDSQVQRTLFGQIYEVIVPVNHRDHVVGTYDYLFVDWKQRLTDRIKITSDQINSAVEYAMQAIQNQQTTYIAEGTGFFSFVYLAFPEQAFTQNHYGSCITYSMLEMYIMSRLHVHGTNMNLLLESAPQQLPQTMITKATKHLFWNFTQKYVGVNVTHWVTRFIMRSKTITFRSVFNIKRQYNFMADREKVFKAFIYPIYDSTAIYLIHMLNQFIMKFSPMHQQAVASNLAFYHLPNVIMGFINRRIALFEQLTQKYLDNNYKLYYIKRKQLECCITCGIRVINKPFATCCKMCKETNGKEHDVTCAPVGCAEETVK